MRNQTFLHKEKPNILTQICEAVLTFSKIHRELILFLNKKPQRRYVLSENNGTGRYFIQHFTLFSNPLQPVSNPAKLFFKPSFLS